MSEQPAWVNNPDDPREKFRLALAEEFTTILYDFGTTVVQWVIDHVEMVDMAVVTEVREAEALLSAPTPEEHRAP